MFFPIFLVDPEIKVQERVKRIMEKLFTILPFRGWSKSEYCRLFFVQAQAAARIAAEKYLSTRIATLTRSTETLSKSK